MIPFEYRPAPQWMVELDERLERTSGEGRRVVVKPSPDDDADYAEVTLIYPARGSTYRSSWLVSRFYAESGDNIALRLIEQVMGA